jgi:solute carrier family 25 (mitochondrial carnitine/acylcarnitine transporter), member 20/29
MGETDDGMAHGGGALQTAKDLFAGAVGGIAQVLIGT